ncbi:hypothetical protein C479_02696 [Halovivax asiaticus JCM 14624]|uniref:Uncharacterized protein n=1 Tax=Halovivax asiaticus JCM 14624 TaxID=1227490 RepID=M0BTJ6_9EURY|nr:hypothetical protein C479_02696 [Halovivax asiaticus JCM 14624]
MNDDATDDETSLELRSTAPSIESYQTEDGIVFYDAENPLAWVETDRTLCLDELV